MKTTSITAVVLSLALGAITAIAGPVTVTNVTAAQRIGEPIVDIAYALLNPSGGLHTVAIEASTNSGVDYSLRCTSFSGAVGAGVTTGAHKQVVWLAANDLPAAITTHARVRVTATDMQADTNGMVLIPAGTFQMGTNNLPYESELWNAGPNHSVTISAFYMDKYEVTSQKWYEVRAWAMANGYTFGTGSGKGATHPVQMVNWYDCVKWCNARSQKEGLTPCYYLDAAQAVLYKTGQSNLWNAAVKWTANGYRLPTEAEWEKAARGGAVGMRFPWSDVQTISRAQANYRGDTSYSYDLGPNGNDPLFTPGGSPYTSPVGYFAANGYGLYDMVGNIEEWCWDWYGSTYYSSSSASDPRGPASSMYRVLRGGYWDYLASLCRVVNRGGYGPPGTAINFIGFRAVRR